MPKCLWSISQLAVTSSHGCLDVIIFLWLGIVTRVEKGACVSCKNGPKTTKFTPENPKEKFDVDESIKFALVCCPLKPWNTIAGYSTQLARAIWSLRCVSQAGEGSGYLCRRIEGRWDRASQLYIPCPERCKGLWEEMKFKLGTLQKMFLTLMYFPSVSHKGVLTTGTFDPILKSKHFGPARHPQQCAHQRMLCCRRSPQPRHHLASEEVCFW